MSLMKKELAAAKAKSSAAKHEPPVARATPPPSRNSECSFVSLTSPVSSPALDKMEKLLSAALHKSRHTESVLDQRRQQVRSLPASPARSKALPASPAPLTRAVAALRKQFSLQSEPV